MSVYRNEVKFEYDVEDRVKLKRSPDPTLNGFVGNTGKVIERVDLCRDDPYVVPAGFYTFLPGYLVEFKRCVFWKKRFHIGESHLTLA